MSPTDADSKGLYSLPLVGDPPRPAGIPSPPPEYRLGRISAGVENDEEVIYPLDADGGSANLSRRIFLGKGLTFGAVLGLLTTEGDGSANDDKLARAGRWEQKVERAAGPGRKAVVVKAHEKGVSALAVSAQGRYLLTGGADAKVKLWSLPEGTLEGTMIAHQDDVQALVMHPKGDDLASGSLDKTIKIWPLKKELEQTTVRPGEFVYALASTPAGDLFASGESEGRVRLWSWKDGKPIRELSGHKGAVRAVAISRDGELLASGAGDWTIRLWSLPEGKVLRSLSGHNQVINALAITPDSETLISGGADATIKFWLLPGGVGLKTRSAESPVNALAITPDGKLLISALKNNTIKLWSLPEGKVVETLTNHKAEVLSLAVPQDGKTLVSGDKDGVVLLWSLPDARLRGYLFDPSTNLSDAIVYNERDKSGRTVTYTRPFGTIVTTRENCVCNAVLGTYKPEVTWTLEKGRKTNVIPERSGPKSRPRPPIYLPFVPPVLVPTGRVCRCVPVCICVPVFR